MKNSASLPRATQGAFFHLVNPCLLAVSILTGQYIWAGGTVFHPLEDSLRAAMAGGGTVTFACNGTITLTNTVLISANTVLDGSGHYVTISGGGLARVFSVATNTSVSISNLVIADGRSDIGAGILNAGGQLTLQRCVLSNNVASGGSVEDSSSAAGTNGFGGGIYNAGAINALACVFVSNSVTGGNGGFPYNGAAGGPGGCGLGGAIANAGTLAISGCVFANNIATGGWGGRGAEGWSSGVGGDGDGGAVANCGTAIITGSLLASNFCVGGPGGAGADGYPGANPFNNGRNGTNGGCGNGGGLFNNGIAVLVNTTLAFNCGGGGQGGYGGGGGGAYNITDYSGDGGRGGDGGSGCGAIYDVSGQCFLTNCTLSANSAIPGPGGFGGEPGIYPFIFISPQLIGQMGAPGNLGAAGCGVRTAGVTLVNTLLTMNSTTNCMGNIIDGGHNLNSDGSGNFHGAGSLTNADPKLEPLADNGGPTLTMALLPGSPAIDAGSAVGAPAADQRGVARPQGPGVDIGAFEYQYRPTFTGMIIQSATNCQLRVCGLWSNETFTLQISSNLVAWLDATNSVARTNGVFQIADPIPVKCPSRFYRLKTGGP